jgi:hypothetical protein
MAVNKGCILTWRLGGGLKKSHCDKTACLQHSIQDIRYSDLGMNCQTGFYGEVF